MYPRATVAHQGMLVGGAPPPPPPPPTIPVSVSPGSLSGYVSGAGAAWTGSASASASGTPPYTYVWNASASGVGVSISGQGSSSASFGAAIPANSHYTGFFSVTVTDADGATGSAGGSLDFYASV